MKVNMKTSTRKTWKRRKDLVGGKGEESILILLLRKELSWSIWGYLQVNVLHETQLAPSCLQEEKMSFLNSYGTLLILLNSFFSYLPPNFFLRKSENYNLLQINLSERRKKGSFVNKDESHFNLKTIVFHSNALPLRGSQFKFFNQNDIILGSHWHVNALAIRPVCNISSYHLAGRKWLSEFIDIEN